MELAGRLETLADRIKKYGDGIETEEATKTTFIMPFISQVLGYDVFDPHEVIPEYTADVGTKKGEKVDYAILRDGSPQILIEAKALKEPLNINHASQLFRYFAVSHARIGILTNGREYLFFTDLEKPNVMDEKPFFGFRLLDLDSNTFPEVAKLAKESFDVESVVNAASELKYVGALKRLLVAQFAEPDDAWITNLASRVYDQRFTAKAREQFTPLVRKAMKQFLNDQVNERLNAALMQRPANAEPDQAPDIDATEDSEVDEDGIVTTPEELEGWQIIKTIACADVDPGRIFHRDTKSYMNVILDDNIRKPIARLYFNRKKKFVGIYNENRIETKHPIDELNGIYGFSEQIRRTVANYAS